MEAKDYEELKRELCKKLEGIKAKGTLGMAEIEVIDKLTHTIKNIDKIMENEEGGYSMGRYSRNGGMWNAEGTYGRNYDNDGYARENSYARQGTHYTRGYYSRGADDVSERIEEMMDGGNLNSDEKIALRRAMEILRK